MSVRLRISVFRLRQLSTGRLYDRIEEARNLDLAVLGNEGCKPPTGVCELPAGPFRLAVLRAPAGRCEVS
jgi:hypothetical protein